MNAILLGDSGTMESVGRPPKNGKKTSVHLDPVASLALDKVADKRRMNRTAAIEQLALEAYERMGGNLEALAQEAERARAEQSP